MLELNLASLLDTGDLIYPENLSSLSSSGAPTIEFLVRARDGQVERDEAITLPCPAGIQINDTGAYNPIDLGEISNSIVQAWAAMNGDYNNAWNAVKGEVASQMQRVPNLQVSEGLRSAGNLLPSSISRGINFGTRQVNNPYQHIDYAGPQIRQFPFTFKFVADSPAETSAIERIVKRFRHYAYPEQTETNFRFPPTWQIRFLHRGSENSNIPKLYDCFLTNISTTLNSSSNLWRYDGSPLEVDVALNFQEVKALSRKEMKELDENGKRGDDSLYSEGDYTDLSDIQTWTENSLADLQNNLNQ